MSNEKAILQRQLERIYNDPSDFGSFGGIDRLYRRAKALGIRGLTRSKVRSFLAGVPAYSLHKPARRHFHRNPTFVQGIDDQWQADLVDMQALARANGGVRYLLTCIDIFSKYAWVVPVKAKSAKEIAEAFRTLFVEAHPRRPRKLQTDKGKEFFNATVQALLRDTYKVEHFSSWSDQKAAVVERFNRTLKERMWRYFSARQTNHYLDVLPKLVKAYNFSLHRSIGMAPAHVSKREEAGVRQRLYGKVIRKREKGAAAAAAALGNSAELPRGGRRRKTGQSRRPPLPAAPPEEINADTMVRISRVKGEFEKGYMPNWSEEDFRVSEVTDQPGGRRVYKLEDKTGEAIQGTWYPEELQPISKNRYLVERVVRRRVDPNTGERECLVEWRGWPKKFNSWVPEHDLQDTDSADTRQSQ